MKLTFRDVVARATAYSATLREMRETVRLLAKLPIEAN